MVRSLPHATAAGRAAADACFRDVASFSRLGPLRSHPRPIVLNSWPCTLWCCLLLSFHMAGVPLVFVDPPPALQSFTFGGVETPVPKLGLGYCCRLRRGTCHVRTALGAALVAHVCAGRSQLRGTVDEFLRPIVADAHLVPGEPGAREWSRPPCAARWRAWRAGVVNTALRSPRSTWPSFTLGVRSSSSTAFCAAAQQRDPAGRHRRSLAALRSATLADDCCTSIKPHPPSPIVCPGGHGLVPEGRA